LDRKKNKFNKAWMHEHVSDHYVQEAKARGYRARAAFKLLEIDDKDRLLQPGQVVVDLGSTPGSWSQVAAAKVGKSGTVIALDVLPMAPVHGVEFIQGDFTDDAVLRQLERALGGRRVDLVLSDMAPNLSGVATVDQARGILLAELALEFAVKWLKPKGSLLVKVFQGEGFDDFRRQLNAAFGTVGVRKPKASRDRSSEVYLLARGPRAGAGHKDGSAPPDPRVTV
jgi:23S rRNA (uridine2552-2'-O)-methyltransferase